MSDFVRTQTKFRVRGSLNKVTLKRSLGDHYCGGSIINYNKVISAAHCKQPNNNWSASAGSVILNAQLQQIAGSSQVNNAVRTVRGPLDRP